jgi:PIN domain nuclease of toxin-antitoxin system
VKVLTDTHTLVWALSSSVLLGKKARQAIDSGEVIVSVANLWELILKRNRKTGLIADPIVWWKRHVVDGDFKILGIHSSHVMALDGMPDDNHSDPFDRILVAQCKVEGAALVTRDRHLGSYGVPLIW